MLLSKPHQRFLDPRHLQREREAVLRNPTVEGAIRYFWQEHLGDPRKLHPDTILAGVHKARVWWPKATPQMVEQSKRWLSQRGLSFHINGATDRTPSPR